MTDPIVLSNRYRLDERLAAGGMGEVWKATDQLLGRPVAVKLLKQQYVSDDAFRSRFLAEARFAASLQHSGIAQVYDYGEQDDLAYLVMELVPGETLSRILTRGGRLSPETTLDIIGQAARGLQVAHTAGIIHRDIKPANLMVTADGTVKITDFGIARGGGASTMTQTGTVMGTAQYVSPEQATGKRITPASDLYSLGVVAYECLAGEPPFVADTPIAMALKHVREDPPPLPADVPPAVRGLVDAMLAKDPEDRPAGAREIADRAYLIGESLGLGEDARSALDMSASGAQTRIVQTPAVEWEDAEGAWATEAVAWAGDTRSGVRSGGAAIGRRNRLILAAACAVVLIGGGAATAGLVMSNSGHSKLVNGNPVQPASGTAPTRHAHHTPIGASSDGPVPSDSFSAPMSPDPEPSSSETSVPTTHPTRTKKPPKPTPINSTTDSPPSSPDPTSSSSVQGPLGSEDRA